MRRAPYVITGTVVGVAGILAFPTQHPHLVIPSSAGSTGGAVTGSATPANTGPAASPAPATTPGPTTTTAPAATTAPAGGVRSATGADEQFAYGDLQVKVTVNGSKITDVAVVAINEYDGRSQAIDAQAVPLLRQQVLAAGSTRIDGVSGATYTSQAYVDSVQSALDALGVK